MSVRALVEVPAGHERRRLRDVADVPRLALRVGEAAAALSMSHDAFGEHVAGELRWVRVGRLKLVPVAELERWLERRAARTLDDEGEER